MSMRQKLMFVIAAILIIAAISLMLMSYKVRQLTAERNRYKNNTELLQSDVQRYKVRDSLNGARVEALEFTIKEFERFRNEDAALIKSLKQKNKDLASINDIQSATIIELSTRPKDTLVIRDSIPIKAKVVRCGDQWYDFEGIMTENDFRGKMECRDSLIVSESIEHARFLGFLWKIPRIKSRQVDIISLNPHTKIDDVIYVVIED